MLFQLQGGDFLYVRRLKMFGVPTNVILLVECAVSAIVDVDWSPESFDCLRIPSETKTILLSLAKTRLGMIPTVPFDDVIDGKGQGFNILLEYVGKTSMPSRLLS